MKNSNEMQQYAHIYLLLNYSTYFGSPSRPSSGVHKTVDADSGTDHTIWGASFLKRNQIRTGLGQSGTVPNGPHCWGFEITLRQTPLGKTPLDEGSAPRRDRYLTKHKTQKRQLLISRAGIEPAIPASERLHNHALDRAATGTGRGWSCRRMLFMSLGLVSNVYGLGTR